MFRIAQRVLYVHVGFEKRGSFCHFYSDPEFSLAKMLIWQQKASLHESVLSKKDFLFKI